KGKDTEEAAGEPKKSVASNVRKNAGTNDSTKRSNSSSTDPPRPRGRPPRNRKLALSPPPPSFPVPTITASLEELLPDVSRKPSVKLPPGPLVDAEGRLLPQAARDALFSRLEGRAKELQSKFLAIEKARKTLHRLQKKVEGREKLKKDLDKLVEEGRKIRLTVFELS
ncbi:hypothetical protein HDU67_003462, partial [Dinochytrium kinnereticum]